MKHFNYNRIVWRSSIMSLILSLSLLSVNAQEHKVRIAAIGNSITYGARLADPASQCYPSQLSAMLSELYGDTCEIFNSGVSGRTMMRSAEDPIWVESVFKSALKFVPDICLIALGTNDSKPYRWDAWGNEFLTDYMAMIDTFKVRNPDVKFIVCYPPPIWKGHPYGTNYSDLHNDSILLNYAIPAIDTVAKRTGAIVVDFHSYFTDSLQLFPDMLHPDAEGSRQMAKILFDTIQSLDLIHNVEAGKALVSDFVQVNAPAAIGGTAELKWTTMFADSVFLDGVLVDASGSKDVKVEAGKSYVLKVKGPKNESVFPLSLKTYDPVKTSITITSSSTAYTNGESVILFLSYRDQYNKPMIERASEVIWSFTEGNATFGEQTDTSIVFIPLEKGKVKVEARIGELSNFKVLSINKEPTAIAGIQADVLELYPNPVSDRLFIDFEKSSITDVQLTLHNSSGSQVFSKAFSGATISLDVSTLAQGVYVYTIRAGNEVFTGKFTKK